MWAIQLWGVNCLLHFNVKHIDGLRHACPTLDLVFDSQLFRVPNQKAAKRAHAFLIQRQSQLSSKKKVSLPMAWGNLLQVLHHLVEVLIKTRHPRGKTNRAGGQPKCLPIRQFTIQQDLHLFP